RRGCDSLSEVIGIIWLGHSTIMSSPLLYGGEQGQQAPEICTVGRARAPVDVRSREECRIWRPNSPPGRDPVADAHAPVALWH
ncbi:MAG: hypothetical protein V3U55_05350, partial [Mycobacterium sp.]